MNRRATALGLWAAVLAGPSVAQAHHVAQEQRLPTIGPAADFVLTSQDDVPVTLRELHGKVVAVAFIYTSCADVCPLLTEKMAQVRDRLGPDFGSRIVFLSITVDPEHDTPAVLKRYADSFGADLAGWRFLTGEPAAVREAAQRYGVVVSKGTGGDVDHTLLTSLVDRQGMLRVQYLGYRFDPEEFGHDLLDLLDEP